MENSKTHYRKVFKSDHLGVADLEEMLEEGRRLIFTVKDVKQYILKSGDKNSGVVVAGRRIGANIAYFEEAGVKPMVLNATNSKIMRSFSGGSPFVEDWNNKLIELYVDPNVTMKGEKVGGVKIRPQQPRTKKPELTPKHKRWEEARSAVKSGKIEGVKKAFYISDANIQLLKA